MTKPNELTFPCPSDLHGEYHHGLTKREYFAAMAMQGWLTTRGGNLSHVNREDMAATAVMCADALINALNPKEVQS